MGCCEPKPRPADNSTSNYYDPETIKSKFKDYILTDNIVDSFTKNYNLNDNVFQSIKKEERDILEKYYKSRKKEFENNMNIYLEKQNLNFITLLTRQIISNEGGREKLEGSIKAEIQKINNNKDSEKIEYLTVMIIGQTGTGKSTLVNSLLKLKGEERAETGLTDIVTQRTQAYKSNRVPYIQLVDTRGIELNQAFDVDKVGIEARSFINQQIKANNVNDFVHCIWYCISSNRFQGVEIDLVNNLINTVESSKIPLIIVMTQADNQEKIEGMKKNIRLKNFENVIAVLAEEIKVPSGMTIPAYGLDKLTKLTVKKCKRAFDADMKQVMIKNLKERIKKTLFSDNAKIKENIILKMMLDTYKKDLANQKFDDYIHDIYYYHVCYFLNKNYMSKESVTQIKNSEFNRHKNNFFSFCQQYVNKLIQNELPYFSNKFLDIQATKEKENGRPVDMVNKRNFNDFINSTGNFLITNFNSFSSKFYINFVMTRIIAKLSTNFEQELNLIVENLILKNDIQNIIDECFYKKFSDYEERVYNNISKKQNNNNILPILEDINLKNSSENNTVNSNGSKRNSFNDNGEKDIKFKY